MAKFKINQKVKFIFDHEGNSLLHILEIEETTCSAGTQVFYIGRLWVHRQYGNPKMGCSKDIWRVNEIELAPVKVEKTKKPKKTK